MFKNNNEKIIMIIIGGKLTPMSPYQWINSSSVYAWLLSTALFLDNGILYPMLKKVIWKLKLVQYNAVYYICDYGY